MWLVFYQTKSAIDLYVVACGYLSYPLWGSIITKPQLSNCGVQCQDAFKTTLINNIPLILVWIPDVQTYCKLLSPKGQKEEKLSFNRKLDLHFPKICTLEGVEINLGKILFWVSYKANLCPYTDQWNNSYWPQCCSPLLSLVKIRSPISKKKTWFNRLLYHLLYKSNPLYNHGPIKPFNIYSVILEHTSWAALESKS